MLMACAAEALVGAGIVIIAGDESGNGRGAPERSGGAVQGSDRFFSNGLSDWVSFADAVVVVRVTREERVSPSPEETQRGEGYVNRVVTIDVEESVWTRSGGPTPRPRSTS